MKIKTKHSGNQSDRLINYILVNALVKALIRALALKDNVPPTDYVLGVWDYVHNRQETHAYGAFGSNDHNYVPPFWKMNEINRLLFETYRDFQSEDFVNNPSKKISPRNIENGFFSLEQKKICVVNFSNDLDVNKMIALLYLTCFHTLEESELKKSDYKYIIDTHIGAKSIQFKIPYQNNLLLRNIVKEFLMEIE